MNFLFIVRVTVNKSKAEAPGGNKNSVFYFIIMLSSSTVLCDFFYSGDGLESGIKTFFNCKNQHL